jgi:hypothetical protein
MDQHWGLIGSLDKYFSHRIVIPKGIDASLHVLPHFECLSKTILTFDDRTKVTYVWWQDESYYGKLWWQGEGNLPVTIEWRWNHREWLYESD